VPINDEKVGDVLARLAAREVAPGGGTAAALHVAQAAALLGMAARFSTGAERAQHHDATATATISRITTEVDELRLLALRLADADSEALSAMAGAARLPAATEAERAARSAAIAQALVNAAWLPSQLISIAGLVVDLAEALAPVGNRNVLPDIASAAEAARAAAAIARVNVEVNLADITDEQASLEMIEVTGRADEVIAGSERVATAIRDQIRA
jgi:formiminotetrahydrofolate cyclodeaminase